MRRTSFFCLALVLGLALLTSPAQPALAAAPQPVEFVLTGHTVGIDEMVLKEHFVRIRGLHAEGAVSGAISGNFSYTEDIGASPDINAAATHGDVTIDTGEGEIRLQFVGRVQLVPGPPPPTVIVVNQPWTIKGGTGAYQHIHGTGRRSTFTDGCPDEFCVRYTGTMAY